MSCASVKKELKCNN